VIEQREAELFEIILAARTAGALARRLHRGEEQRDQHADDRNDDQEFDQREGGMTAHKLTWIRQQDRRLAER
jgi:hypothetical protein